MATVSKAFEGQDGKVRKALVQYRNPKPEHFQMEGLHLLKTILNPGSFMIKIDLKDAYLSVPISHNLRHLLRFIVDNQTYQFRCLPFGLNIAPRVFTKLLKPIVALLRSQGAHMIAYLDDILLTAATKIGAQYAHVATAKDDCILQIA